MKLLLINPKFPESFWSMKWAIDKILPEKRTINPPLGLATLAALSPQSWEIKIVDENIESIPLDPDADLIGICGMGVQFERQKELIRFYKAKGYFVVAGGSYASLCPESYDSLPDAVVAGEAEYIWKEFCRDFTENQPKKLYQEKGVVSLEDSPCPRFDLLDLKKYQKVSLQFSRGCPFQCEFCDIIVMFGRKPRTKTLEQVGRELDALREFGVSNVFFVDDNLIGNKPAAKGLAAYLRDYQKNHGYKFHFGTEASLNMAYDEELLKLFKEANFEWVFIGIESPDEASLKETKKVQNMNHDILASVRKIYSYGIEVFAGFIIGFDNDTVRTFDLQHEFIVKSGIQAAMIGMLTAIPKTPLYKRLEKEGRLIPDSYMHGDNSKLKTNVVPKQMSYEVMVEKYRELHESLLSDKLIGARVKNKTRYLRKPLYSGDELSGGDLFQTLRRFVGNAILPGGFSRLYYFLKSFPFFTPRLIPVVVQDWIIGLSMQNYVQRHFVQSVSKESQKTYRYYHLLEKSFQKYFREGVLKASFQELKNAAFDFSISMTGFVDRPFFTKASRHLRKILKNSHVSVTLHIDNFQAAQSAHLKKLLKRLAQYGDRVNIVVREELRGVVSVDSSVFNLVLGSSTLPLV